MGAMQRVRCNALSFRLLLFCLLATGPLGHACAGSVKFPLDGNVLGQISLIESATLPQDRGPGGLVKSYSIERIGTEGISCRSQKTVVVNGVPVPGDPKTFKTNLDGFGIRFFTSEGWQGLSSMRQAPFSETLDPTPAAIEEFFLRADLVLTGPHSTGTLTLLPSMTITFSGPCYPTVSRTVSIRPGDVFKPYSCEVTTPVVQVPLPAVTQADLPAVNATAGETAFTLGLRCPSGDGTLVHLTLTDASDIANRSTTLGLAPGSSASGVGLQILDRDTVAAYGPDSARAGTPNQWEVGRVGEGIWDLPLKVRYIRTQDKLGGGSVIGKATFTLSYQ